MIKEQNMNMPYSEENLMKMKEDIADRTFNVKVKGMFITGAFLALAVVALIFAPQVFGAFAPLIGLVGAVGSAIAGLATIKETKKLQMDEEYLQSYMQGKNYWGKGYREEIAERGYSLSSPVPGLPPQGNDIAR
jgi:hypothetical protein